MRFDARFLMPHEAIAIVLVVAVAATAMADSQETVRRLIPTPKQCVLEKGAMPVAAQGKANLAIFVPARPDRKESLAADWVAKEVATLAGAAPSIATGPAPAENRGQQTQLVLATYDRPSENLKQVVGLLDESDRGLLSDPKRSEQAYVLRCSERRIAIVGGSAQGTLYGAMTLLQLLEGDRTSLAVARVHVRDWPDFRYREAENWEDTEGRLHWGRGWCYDWGDGPENYKKRVEGLFDRCLRYKINMICFSSGFGEPFSRMWDGDAFPIQKELNRLAAERGIKLMIGGYGNGAGDKTLLNRESYPDGKQYHCLTTNNFGNCRSNDELTRKIQGHIREYVRKTEPRALYIHHEDSDSYASAEWLWAHRCQRCRKRWPNDAMAAADGAAGAFASGYNALGDAIFSVKNADSGYDASRDCLFIPISPTYTAAYESDAIWDKQLAYWRAVAKLLKYKQNVCLGFREQFLRADNNKQRIVEMSEMLRGEHGLGMFVFFVSPASLYERGPLFVPVPAAMSKLNEGTDVAYYMCGNIFQEPMILMNAAHMWNTESLGAIPLPASAGQCRALYNRYAKRQADPPGSFGPGGFLEMACRSLYGEKAGKHMEDLYAMKKYPICFAKSLFNWNIRSGLYYDWTSDLKTTQEAIAYVEAALREPDCNKENRPIVERLLKSLRAGERFVRIRLAYQALIPLALQGSMTAQELQRQAASLEEQVQSMERYLKESFTFQWATPRGGDAGIWKTYLASMRQELAANVKRWGESIRARQDADRQEAAGRASLVVNGDMEEKTGWKFTCVTNEGDAGYADGGYVTDQAAQGKCSYRIKKLPVKKLSDKWPMPVRATWGEIEQEIRVQPGQTYVVAFEVFNNYGESLAFSRCEHQVLVDDQERWSLDASAPKGWKAGGFYVTTKTATVRLRLKTTDVRPCGGWFHAEGDSWWDRVRVYPLKAEATKH